MRAISRMFWNRRLRRSTSATTSALCSRRSSSFGHDAWRFVAATRMAVSGVRRSWAIDASSADFSSSLRRDSSAAFRSSRNCARSTAIAATPPSASSVPASTGRPATASRPTALAPNRSGTSSTAWPPASIGPVAVGDGHRRPQLRAVERQHQRSGLGHAPPVALRQADPDVVQRKAPGDEAGERRDRLVAVGQQQDVAAEIEQPRDLVAPGERFVAPGARR